MLQDLLARRFGLTYHRDRKQMPGYALTVSARGPALVPSRSSPSAIPGKFGFGPIAEGVAAGAIKNDSVGTMRRFAAGAMSLPALADYLAGRLNAPVSNMTRLSGNYDVVLYWDRTPDAARLDSGPDLATAVRDQLGLELRPQAVTVERLVIDRIDQTPSVN